MSLKSEALSLLKTMGVTLRPGKMPALSPITGETLAEIAEHSAADAANTIATAHQAYREWRTTPPPQRGELVRLLGEEFAPTKPRLASWSRSRSARSPRKVPAKCRK